MDRGFLYTDSLYLGDNLQRIEFFSADYDGEGYNVILLDGKSRYFSDEEIADISEYDLNDIPD